VYCAPSAIDTAEVVLPSGSAPREPASFENSFRRVRPSSLSLYWSFALVVRS